MSAADAVLAAARAALAGVEGLAGVFEAGPVRAMVPFATLEVTAESDWGHKSGDGRELRLAATVRDEGESGARARAIVALVEAALLALPAALDGWRIASVALLRTRAARERAKGGTGGWAATSEFRVRMLAD